MSENQKGAYFFINTDNSNNVVFCANKVMRVVVGFGGEEAKLSHTKEGKILPHYEIKKEDIYLLQGNDKTSETIKIIPSNIFLAGSSFNSITSRNLEITYPISRKKLHHERFIDFPVDCASISNTPTKLAIAKIYKDGKVFAAPAVGVSQNIEFVEFKSQNQRMEYGVFRADIGFASGNNVHTVRLEG